MPPLRHVDLDRRFVDLDPSAADHPEDPSALPWLPRTEGYSWSDLTEQRCAVILAEAGSGKSAEFEEQALRRASRPAFLCTVTDLATEGIGALKRAPGFTTWFDTGGVSARLFLDSVDTALIEHQTLKKALDKLRSDLGPKWDSCHLLLSCRGSDWRSETDLETLERYFPAAAGVVASGAASRERAFRIVRMLPLDQPRARRLAEDILGPAVSDFIEAVHSAQAEFFLTRPLDVRMLAEIWQERHEIPPLHRLLQLVIEKKLVETNGDRPRSAVSPTELRDGARALAAAQLLCRTSHIRVPDSSAWLVPETDLDPTKVLPAAAPSTVAELLTRALFDVPTYGRARFHHRSVQEYLAAEWLRERLGRGCPLDDVLDQLFRNVYGRRVAIPSRASVLGWLAGMVDTIRDETLRHAPEVLIRSADPTVLPVPVRRQALRSFVDQHSSDRFEGRRDEATLRRFAHPALADDIAAHMTGSLPEGVAVDLLDMVRVGELSASGEVALRQALDASQEMAVRIVAIDAIAAVGTDEQVSKLIAYVVDTPQLDASFVAAACQKLFPKRMDLQALLAVLRRACPQPSDRPTGIGWYVARRVREMASPVDAIGLANGLLAILREFGANGRWLVACTLEIGSHLVTQVPEQVDDDLFAALYELYLDDRYRVSRARDFIEALRKRQDVRARLFWHVVRRERGREVRNRLFKIRYVFSEALDLGEQDLEWLLRDATGRSDPFERNVAIDAAMIAGRIGWDGELEGARGKILASTSEDSALRRHFDREVDRRTRPSNDPWAQQRLREDTAREHARARQRAENASYIRAHLEELRAGNPSANIVDHLYHIMARAGGHNRWGVAHLPAVAEEYGSDIAEAAEQGFSRYWKTYSPLLPHERENRNTAEVGLVCGLSGLLILSAHAGAFSRMSADEARLAATYACSEMNGFPEWFGDLGEAHPEAVVQILREAVAGEYRYVPVNGVVPRDVLADLNRLPLALLSALGPSLVELLGERPGHLSFVEQILSALVALPEVARDLEATARAALERDASADALITWWPTWFAFAPSDAFAFLDAWRAQQSDASAAEAEGRFHEIDESSPMASDDTPVDPQSALLTVLCSMRIDELETSLLVRIVRMLLEVAPHDGDIQHRGTYSPTVRDDVQHVRDGAIRHLADRPGAAAHHALLELAEVTGGKVAEWFRHQARLRAEADAEPDRWQEEDIATFGESFVRVPRNSAALFEIALARLRDVRRYLEGGDFSVKGVYLDKLEFDLQRLLAHELHVRAAGCYTVERETEVIEENRTDIRLRAGSALVTIELKRVQECGVTELEHALEVQLVGQYMRDDASRFGVLVLCFNGNPSKQWKAPTGGWWNVDDVVEHLKKQALALLAVNSMAENLEVVLIDFRS